MRPGLLISISFMVRRTLWKECREKAARVVIQEHSLRVFLCLNNSEWAGLAKYISLKVHSLGWHQGEKTGTGHNYLEYLQTETWVLCRIFNSNGGVNRLAWPSLLAAGTHSAPVSRPAWQPMHVLELPQENRALYISWSLLTVCVPDFALGKSLLVEHRVNLDLPHIYRGLRMRAEFYCELGVCT